MTHLNYHHSFFDLPNIHVGLSNKSSEFTPDAPPFEGPVYWMNRPILNTFNGLMKTAPILQIMSTPCFAQHRHLH